MNDHPVAGRVEVKVGLSARASIQHTGGWTWESRWLLVTKYLARLQEIYSGAQIESNTDLWAITNSFMIDGYHLSEAFFHQLSLRAQVASTVANSPELQLCRDYANTWKHSKRNSNVRIAYIWEDGDSATGGHFVTIAIDCGMTPSPVRRRSMLSQWLAPRGRHGAHSLVRTA